MSPRLKTALNIVGTILALAALVVVASSFLKSLNAGEFDSLGRQDIAVVAAFSVVSGLLNIFLCEAFHSLSVQLEAGFSRRISWKVFGTSQIGKYMPGNVMHLLGRQALGGAAGVSQKSLAKIAFIELCSLALAGGLFVIFIADRFIGFLTIPLWVEIGLYGSAVAAAMALLGRLLGRPVALTFMWHKAFLMIMGALFFALLRYLGNDTVRIIDVITAYILSWLIGFITPGAPAGIGVREYVLLILLGGAAGSALVIVAVALARLINVIGDILTLLISLKAKGAQ